MDNSARFLFGFGLLGLGALVSWGSLSGNLAAILAVMFDRSQLTSTAPKRSSPISFGSVASSVLGGLNPLSLLSDTTATAPTSTAPAAAASGSTTVA